MNKLKYFLCLTLWFLMNSCQKDNLSECITSEPDCLTESGQSVVNFDSIVDFTLCIHTIDYVPLHRYEYSNPVFNPNNANEIIYFRIDYGTSGFLKQELWKYNFCSNNTSYITDLAFYGIDWSSKDWIIYTGNDQQLYKLKSNGDSLTQLTNNNEYNSWAKWNDDGTKYLYHQTTLGLVIADEKGEKLDTLSGLFAKNWSWDNNRIFFSSNTNNYNLFGEYDIVENEMNILDSFLIENNIISPIKFNKIRNELIFLAGNEIFHFYHLANKQTDHRITGFDNRTYGYFDTSPDGKTIIYSRSNLTQVDACTIEGDQFLHLIDTSGDNERVLSIPE